MASREEPEFNQIKKVAATLARRGAAAPNVENTASKLRRQEGKFSHAESFHSRPTPASTARLLALTNPALIIGDSVGGLLAAAAVSETFDDVLLVEKAVLSDEPVPRTPLGDTIRVRDARAYTRVTAHMFNSIDLSAAYAVSSDGQLELKRSYTYSDFLARCAG